MWHKKKDIFLNKKGFTLIELLVVIAIIGLLSSVVLASLNTARSKSRDARRKSDLNQMKIAMEFYYDKYGNYKLEGGGSDGNGNGWFGLENGGSYSVAASRILFNEGFIGAPLVDDPIQDPGYMIYHCDNSQEYAITATLENPTAEDISFAEQSCYGEVTTGTYDKNYAVTN